MANDSSNPNQNPSHITLSQAILAPVQSLLQAQTHAARSFLNLLLQTGFDHKGVANSGDQKSGTPSADGNSGDAAQSARQKDKDANGVYRLAFEQTRVNAKGEEETVTVSIPTIAAIPMHPLAIEEAEVEFSMRLGIDKDGDGSDSYVRAKSFSNAGQKAKQTQADGQEADKYDQSERPWFLVDQPVDLQGQISPKQGSSEQPEVSVKMKVSQVEAPEALRRFISNLNDFSTVETEVTKEKGAE